MPDSISMPSSIAARVKGLVIGTPYGSEADLASGKAGILADHVAAARIAGARPGARSRIAARCWIMRLPSPFPMLQ
jgi:hypothetical protein